MSIYSGFATRHQEDAYNKLLAKAVLLMGDKLAAFKGEILSKDAMGGEA